MSAAKAALRRISGSRGLKVRRLVTAVAFAIMGNELSWPMHTAADSEQTAAGCKAPGLPMAGEAEGSVLESSISGEEAAASENGEGLGSREDLGTGEGARAGTASDGYYPGGDLTELLQTTKAILSSCQGANSLVENDIELLESEPEAEQGQSESSEEIAGSGDEGSTSGEKAQGKATEVVKIQSKAAATDGLGAKKTKYLGFAQLDELTKDGAAAKRQMGREKPRTLREDHELNDKSTILAVLRSEVTKWLGTIHGSWHSIVHGSRKSVEEQAAETPSLQPVAEEITAELKNDITKQQFVEKLHRLCELNTPARIHQMQDGNFRMSLATKRLFEDFSQLVSKHPFKALKTEVFSEGKREELMLTPSNVVQDSLTMQVDDHIFRNPRPAKIKAKRSLQKSRPPLGFGFSPSAFLAAYHFGVIDILKEHGLINSKVPCAGASGGGLALLAMCYPDEVSNFLCVFDSIYERSKTTGVAGQLYHLLVPELEELIPESMHKIFSERPAPLSIAITEVYPKFAATRHSTFYSKNDLIQGLTATSAIPFYFNGWPTSKFRGKHCVDGAFSSNHAHSWSPASGAIRTVYVVPFFADHTFKLVVKGNLINSLLSLFDAEIISFLKWEEQMFRMNSLLMKSIFNKPLTRFKLKYPACAHVAIPALSPHMFRKLSHRSTKMVYTTFMQIIGKGRLLPRANGPCADSTLPSMRFDATQLAQLLLKPMPPSLTREIFEVGRADAYRWICIERMIAFKYLYEKKTKEQPGLTTCAMVDSQQSKSVFLQNLIANLDELGPYRSHNLIQRSLWHERACQF